MYIIIWRNSHQQPFIDVDSRNFKEDYSTYEQAIAAAEEIMKNEGIHSQWYFDYKIYKEVNN